MAYVGLILSFIIGALQIPKLFKEFKSTPLIILLLAITAFVVSIKAQRNADKLEKYGINAGSLNGSLSCNRNYVIPCMAIGGAHFIKTRGGPVARFGDFMDSLDLQVWVRNGKLYVSTTVFSYDKNLIATINANEFTVANPGSGLSFDRNFDDDGVEVLDSKGNVALQVYFDSGCVHVGGLFYKSTGKAPFELVYPCKGGGGCVAFDSADFQNFSVYLKPIFKYPSKLHPGERVTAK